MGQTKEQRVIKQLSGVPTVQKQVPIMTGMFLPNHSGVSTHPEVKQNFYTKTEVDDLDDSHLQDANDYTDIEIANIDFWSRVTGANNYLTPKTSTDGIRVEKGIGIGTTPTGQSAINVNGFTTNADGGVGIALTPGIYGGYSGGGIGGYAIPNTGNYAGKSLYGLEFGIFGFLTSVSGSPNSTGVSAFGYGNYGGTHTINQVASFNIEGLRSIGGTLNITDYYGFKGTALSNTGGSTWNITNEYTMFLGKPVSGTNNYQCVLSGNGTGSGIWLDGTSGERVYSDGTNFCSASPIKCVGGLKSSDGSAGITATITTAKLTAGGANGSMTFKNGILTAQTQAT